MIFSVQIKESLSSLAILALTFSLLSSGCQKSPGAASMDNSSATNQKAAQQIATQTDNGSLSTSLPKTASIFDAPQAWQDLVYQVEEIGPRYVGSVGSTKTRQWLKNELNNLGAQVYEQKFTANTTEGPKEFINIIACLEPNKATQTTSNVAAADKSKETQNNYGNQTATSKDTVQSTTIVLGAHYDTKYFKDINFVGANDGASGTAVLLELARVFKRQPLLF